MDAMTPANMLQAAPPSAAQQIAAMPPVPPKPVTHDLTIVTTRKLAQAKVLGVPPEEFGIERGARDIKTCNYCFHEVVTKTEGELIDEGFDEDQVKALPDYTGTNDIETIARDTVQEHTGGQNTGVNSAARQVRITEHYIRMDYEGTGRACLYMVTTGGSQGEILERDGKECIDPIDVIPFAATTPVPITHRFFGRSIADLVLDIQKIKTSLLRAGLDSKYLSSGADVEIAESHVGPSTIDDLLGPKRPGRVIRTKLPGGLNYQVVPDTSEASFKAMGYMDTLLEMRTGVTRQGQGVDADALQNQSATAVAQVFSASQARMKLIARIMAEGVRDIFALLHHTIRSHGQEKQTVRLRNKWVDVDPRNWKTRNDMTINVGLGSGGKAQQYAQLMGMANFQKELLLGGKSNIVSDGNLYNTAAEIAKVMGHKSPDRFFQDPDEKDPNTGQLVHPPAQPPPDPKVLAVQAQAEADKADITLKAQLDQQKAHDAAQLAQVKAEFDARLKLIEAQLNAVAMNRQAAHDQQTHRAKVAETVVGVIADAHKHDMAMAHEQQTHEMKIEQGQQAHDAKLEQMAKAPKPTGGK